MYVMLGKQDVLVIKLTFIIHPTQATLACYTTRMKNKLVLNLNTRANYCQELELCYRFEHGTVICLGRDLAFDLRCLFFGRNM